MEDSVVCSWPLDPTSSDVPYFQADNATPCEIRCTSQSPLGRVLISSNARTCELRSADPAGAYLATVRGVEAPGGGFDLDLDIQAYCRGPVHAVVLRMLSLQEKGNFCLQSLEVVAAEDDQPADTPAAMLNPQETQMAAVRQMLRDAQTGAKGDPRQQFMAGIANAALMKEGLQKQQGNAAVGSSELGWAGGGAHGMAESCAREDTSSAKGPDASRSGAASLDDFEAAINAATERALEKYRKGVEKILEDSLAMFESRLGRIMQQVERHDPP